MNISVIIPIHEYNDELSGLVTKSVESVLKQENLAVLPKVLLVYPTELDASIVGFRDSILRKHSVSGVAQRGLSRRIMGGRRAIAAVPLKSPRRTV